VQTGSWRPSYTWRADAGPHHTDFAASRALLPGYITEAARVYYGHQAVVDPHSVTESACAGHTRRFCRQTFVDDISCLLGLDVHTPPEASRQEEKHSAESGRPSGQKVRFTQPCGTAVASVHNGMWRRPVLCGRPVACGDISRQCIRSPKNPALQLLQKSSKSASTTPQRPIWNSVATLGVRDFWENGCKATRLGCSPTMLAQWRAWRGLRRIVSSSHWPL